MIEDKKYSWSDADVLAIISRDYLEEDLEGMAEDFESGGVGEGGQMSEEFFQAIKEEVRENLWMFLRDCYSQADEVLTKRKKAVQSTLFS